MMQSVASFQPVKLFPSLISRDINNFRPAAPSRRRFSWYGEVEDTWLTGRASLSEGEGE